MGKGACDSVVGGLSPLLPAWRGQGLADGRPQGAGRQVQARRRVCAGFELDGRGPLTRYQENRETRGRTDRLCPPRGHGMGAVRSDRVVLAALCRTVQAAGDPVRIPSLRLRGARAETVGIGAVPACRRLRRGVHIQSYEREPAVRACRRAAPGGLGGGGGGGVAGAPPPPRFFPRGGGGTADFPHSRKTQICSKPPYRSL